MTLLVVEYPSPKLKHIHRIAVIIFRKLCVQLTALIEVSMIVQPSHGVLDRGIYDDTFYCHTPSTRSISGQSTR
jgi:hypothetical protein